MRTTLFQARDRVPIATGQFRRSTPFSQDSVTKTESPGRLHCSSSTSCGRLVSSLRGAVAWLGLAIISPLLATAAIGASPIDSTAQEPGQQSGQEPVKVEVDASQLLVDASRALNAADYPRATKLAKLAVEAKPEQAAALQSAAEILYLSGAVKECLPVFDKVVKLEPASAPHNWQRGIALCTLGDFAEGAAQFKQHHDVNPDDVENSAWYFLCIAKTEGVEAARKTVIPSRGDGRQPMMTVLKMLQGEVEPAEVLKAATAKQVPVAAQAMAQFYADLYVGLYYDSLGDAEQAVKYLKRSQQYGRNGYMVRTAQVYLDARFPTGKSTDKDDPR